MRDPRYARPFAIFVLFLPYGIGGGFVSLTLPFILTQGGVSVAAVASILAIAMLPNTWRFIGAPLVDLTLSLRRWYLVGLGASITMLLVLGLLPIRPDTVPLITAAALLQGVGALILGAPVSAMMAHCVADAERGRAAGWYQAANLGGAGLGGGAGVWLVSHYSTALAVSVLTAMALACAVAVLFVPDVPCVATGERLGARLREIGRDFRELTRSVEARLVAVMVSLPISTAAASFLWSAIAPEWRASANLLALTTGVLGGVASTIGCVIGGWLADRVGPWRLFFGTGVAMALAAILMALASRTPASFAVGVFGYSLVQGTGYAAFSALLLHAIGRGAAATKYAVLSSLGNVPVIYMTALAGWAHDRWGIVAMLNLEAVLALIVIPFGMLALRRIRSVPQPLPATVRSPVEMA